MKTSIFKKVYSGKIKRAISEGQLVPSETPEFYIEKEQEQIIEYVNNTNLYPTKVYNVVEKSSYIEVTTNTLNVQFTDVFQGETPLYFKIQNIPEEALPSNTLYKVVGDYTYLNLEVPYIQYESQLFLVEKAFNTDIWANDSKVKIRRLKDRFKLTFRTSSKFSIKLPSKSLFTPQIYKNWIKLTDCFFPGPFNKVHLLSSHSYEFYDKEELHLDGTKIILKDMPITDIFTQKVGSFVKVSYKTCRTNLHSSTDLGSHLYYSLKEEDNSYNLKKDLSSFVGIPLFKVINNPTKIKNFVQNPYMFSPLYKIKPENLYLIWDKLGKYSEDSNVPLGCTKFTMSLKRYLERTTQTFKGSSAIYSPFLEVVSGIADEFQTIDYQGSTRLDVLKNIATTGVIS